MSKLPDEKISLWMDTATNPGYPTLEENINTDVVIVGAGIVGLTSAYLLKKAGKKVVVLEKDTIGAGSSGHTTGKITSQHNLIYAKLQKRLGTDIARIYGEANEAALGEVERIVREEGIDCDFRREDNYVYTTDPEKVEEFKDEASIAAGLGLPATFETTTGLPFTVAASVKFSNQATFHVQKYLLGLAKYIDSGGSRVFEHSRAIRIKDGAPGHVRTPKAKVTAQNIIVATKVPAFPLAARGTYCIIEYPMQSYIVAGKTSRAMRGMYISPDKQHYSILPVQRGADTYVLIGGEGHIPGTRLNPTARYERLAKYAKEHFGVEAIEYRWTDFDYLGYDDMPLIGRVYPWSEHLYTATGCMKWGLTNGTVAAMILCDSIMGKATKWAEVFDPHRPSAPRSIPKVIGEKLSPKG